ncbi:MAG: hypothetical protein EBX52_07145, partial [Proteobacteria bacterium]|nr:hypothetical protein [Pseudomonadota bacterium]
MGIEIRFMKVAAVLFALASAGSPLLAATFDPKLCGDRHLVSKEMVEYHLAGAHWQGGESPCLDQRRFKSLLSEHQSAGDDSLLSPAYVVPKGAEVKIESETEVGFGGVEVRFSVPAIK